MPRKSKNEPVVAPKKVSSNKIEEIELLDEDSLEEDASPDISVFRPDREGIRKVLGDLEADIMEYIWQNVKPDASGITVREVYEAFRLRRVIAYTTVMSTMARLARKHLLNAHKVEAAYVYRPNSSKEEFIDNFVARILENLLVSFSDNTEAHLQRLSTGDAAGRVSNLRDRITKLRGNASPTANDSLPGSSV